jgi:hypothetical protein
MQWQTAPARWRVLFGKVAEKYRAGGRMQTEYAILSKATPHRKKCAENAVQW